MARTPIMAAGGIVLRQGRPPLIAVVRLRKRDEWVLPKGKLDVGETPSDAAMREVKEETGHDVTQHEFLGTLVYESGGRSKVVHYWRMEACGGQVHELMSDVREVDWLSVDAAVQRLSRAYERAFLANIGPLAVEAALAKLSRRKPKVPAPKRRRSRPAAPASPPPLTEPAATDLTAELPPVAPAAQVAVESDIVAAEPAVEAPEQVTVDAQGDPLMPAAAVEPADNSATDRIEGRRKSLAQRLRDLLPVRRDAGSL